MGKKYLVNALTLNMVADEATEGGFPWKVISQEEAKALYAEGGWIAAIGHADTAAVVASHLGTKDTLEARINVVVQPGDILLVAQLKGTRLPAGAKTLPEGAKIVYYLVTVK